MKRLAVILVIVMCFSFPAICFSELSRVEKLTLKEKAIIVNAEKNIQEIVKLLDEIKKEIAIAHKMKAESWMEWQTWVEFDGDFILLYYKSNM